MSDLVTDLISTVVNAATNSPRSRQVDIGPSEIGHECARHLAYKTARVKPTRVDADPWASIVGTAVHAWLASAFAAANLFLDEPRWLVEQRVYPHAGYPGSCDLYDLLNDVVIDHKVVGVTTLREARAHGPSQQYRVQAQLYALGWARLGRLPQQTIIAYWPRSGPMSGLHLHREAYNPQVALEALTRISGISAAALALGLDSDSSRAALIPASPGAGCKYCPFRSMIDGDGGCVDAELDIPQARGKVSSLTL